MERAEKGRRTEGGGVYVIASLPLLEYRTREVAAVSSSMILRLAEPIKSLGRLVRSLWCCVFVWVNNDEPPSTQPPPPLQHNHKYPRLAPFNTQTHISPTRRIPAGPGRWLRTAPRSPTKQHVTGDDQQNERTAHKDDVPRRGGCCNIQR